MEPGTGDPVETEVKPRAIKLGMPALVTLTRSRISPLLPAVCSLLLLIASPAFAFRCGSKVVSKGDHYTKVLKYCGEPIGVQQRMIYREGRTRPRVSVGDPNGIQLEREVQSYERSYVEVVVEEWTYNLGPRKLMRLVRFENGFVADVEQLGYGFNP